MMRFVRFWQISDSLLSSAPFLLLFLVGAPWQVSSSSAWVDIRNFLFFIILWARWTSLSFSMPFWCLVMSCKAYLQRICACQIRRADKQTLDGTMPHFMKNMKQQLDQRYRVKRPRKHQLKKEEWKIPYIPSSTDIVSQIHWSFPLLLLCFSHLLLLCSGTLYFFLIRNRKSQRTIVVSKCKLSIA